MRSRIWLLEEQTVAELGELYVQAYRGMVGQLAEVMARYNAGAETWSHADLAFRARTESLLQGIGGEIARLTDRATAAVFDAAVRGYQAGWYGRAWLLDVGTRAVSAINLPLLPVEAIRAAILQPYQGGTFVDRFINARAEFEQRIRNSIVQSQIQGESIAQATKRIQSALGLPGGKVPGGHAARVEMVARTEILRSSNAGAAAIYEQNADILSAVEWLATNDERTCPTCGVLDGQQWAVGKAPQPPDHPRCRCTLLPVLKNQSLEQRIVGPRKTYRQWAAEHGVSMSQDGGVLHTERGKPAPKAAEK